MFDHIIASEKSSNPIRITAVAEADFKNWLGKQTNGHQAWVKSSGYEGKRGTHLALPGEAGAYQTVVISYVDDAKTQWDFAALPGALPVGEYILTDDVTENDAVCEKAVLGLYLGGYRFDRYRGLSSAPTEAPQKGPFLPFRQTRRPSVPRISRAALALPAI